MNKLNDTIKQIKKLDSGIMAQTQIRLDNLTKPLGSLGKLEDLAKLIAGITGKDSPELKNKVIFTLASDHGVTQERVSAYPKEVTAQMVYNFLRGGAAINVLARHVGARVVVVDIGVAEDLKPAAGLVIKKINYGTKNMVKGPAMTPEEALKAIVAGIEIFENELKKGIDIIGTGEMGIGNTTASSAIAAVFTNASVEDVTGKGAGVDDYGLSNKIKVISESIRINKPNPKDPLDVLAKVGGFEIAGLAGIILAAAASRVPVVIDGFISGAAALIAYRLEPKSREYMIASHISVEKGHRIILEHIGLDSLFDFNLRLGEGTGAALGIGVADAAIKILTQMASFKSAGVSEKG